MIFVPLNGESYNEYIERIKSSNRKIEPPYHKHHIVPRSLGGTNNESNLIILYFEEHYYAHKLLAIENPDNDKLNYAWWLMCHIRKTLEYVTAEEYAEAKYRHSILMSQNNPNKDGKSAKKRMGQKHTEESKEKNRQSQLKNRECGIGNLNPPPPMHGKDHARARKVRCNETGQVFNYCREAADWANIAYSTLCCHLKGHTKTAGGYTWSYVESVETAGDIE